MKIKHFVEKVEGETELEFDFKNGIVNNVNIVFPFYRGIEEILRDRDALDALVITPRVCGICNHAHLLASARAIENGLQNAGVNINLTPKAISLREFTLYCEIIQSHFKWFYLIAMPQLANLNKLEISDNHILKASWANINTVKALAIFAGQWPHSSYIVPGGVTCDPTYEEIVQAEALIDDIIKFTQNEFLGLSIDEYYKTKEISSIKGDMGIILSMLKNQNMQEKGKSYDRFLALGEHSAFTTGIYNQSLYSDANITYVKEHVQSGSKAKSVSYDNQFCEVGPLARAMLGKNNFILDTHNKYQDSALTRVCARMDELINLLIYTKDLLTNLNVKELSCTLSKLPKDLEANGTGIVEAARGSLIHQSTIKSGKIQNYSIITPTQWNLSNGLEQSYGIATKAMRGSINTQEANFIFRTFDVCSVCTTH